jgi:hydrogenase-4 component F
MELIILLSSLLIAALVCLITRHRAVIEWFSVGASLVALAGATIITYRVTTTGPYSPYILFSVDALGAIVMLIVSVVGAATMAYSVPYLREETRKQVIHYRQVKLYYILLNLFLSAMLFAVVANNPIFTWISIEATTLSTAFLISFYKKPKAIEAAWKYLIINSIGLLLGFFGTILFFTSLIGIEGIGFATWDTLQTYTSHFDPTIAKIAFVFIVIGYGTKVGLAPMHTWLPDAHSKAPVPISALLSGVLLNVAFIALLRFKVLADASIGAAFSQKLLIVFGFLSILIASLIIVTQNNYKRLLAYSSIENMGLTALGFGLGGIGIFAAILHMIYHSLIKSALFLSSGNVFLKYSSTKIVNIRGMITALPITGVLFLIGLFAITGTPPCGVFFTKILILTAGIHTHPAVTIAAIFLLALVFVGFLKNVIFMMFGKKPDTIVTGEKVGLLSLAPLLLLAIAFFISFYMPPFLVKLLNEAAAHF